MARFEVTIINPGAPSTVVQVDATSYEENEKGHLLFVRGTDNKRVATFRTWDYTIRTQEEAPPP